MAGAEHTTAVGEYLPVQLLGFRVPSLPAGEPGQDDAGGQGVGMVVAEDPLRCVVRGAAAMLEANRQSRASRV